MNKLVNQPGPELSELELLKLEQQIKALRERRKKQKKEVIGGLIDKLKKIPEDSPAQSTIQLLMETVAMLKEGQKTRRGRKIDEATKAKLMIAIEAGLQSPAQLSKAYDVSLSYVWWLKRKHAEHVKRQEAAAKR